MKYIDIFEKMFNLKPRIEENKNLQDKKDNLRFKARYLINWDRREKFNHDAIQLGSGCMMRALLKIYAVRYHDQMISRELMAQLKDQFDSTSKGFATELRYVVPYLISREDDLDLRLVEMKVIEEAKDQFVRVEWNSLEYVNDQNQLLEYIHGLKKSTIVLLKNTREAHAIGFCDGADMLAYEELRAYLEGQYSITAVIVLEPK